MASPFASSRSLLVWDPENPEQPMTVKVGLDAKVAHVPRNLSPTEALHATLVSAGLRQIPTAYFEEIGFQPAFEDTALVPNGYEVSLIYKNAASEKGYVTLFALFSQGESGTPLLREFARNAGKSPEKYARENLIRPLLQALSRLYLDYGFMPEPHPQNITLRIDNGGITGFGFKDLSGVAIDWEIRRRRGLDNSYLKKAERKHKELFDRAYHVDRGQTYAEKAIDLHFSQGLVAGIVRSFDAASYDGEPELEAFITGELNRILWKEKFRPSGNTWSERFRSVVQVAGQRCPWADLAP